MLKKTLPVIWAHFSEQSASVWHRCPTPFLGYQIKQTLVLCHDNNRYISVAMVYPGEHMVVLFVLFCFMVDIIFL